MTNFLTGHILNTRLYIMALVTMGMMARTMNTMIPAAQ
jgi:hypothetical protein